MNTVRAMIPRIARPHPRSIHDLRDLLFDQPASVLGLFFMNQPSPLRSHQASIKMNGLLISAALRCNLAQTRIRVFVYIFAYSCIRVSVSLKLFHGVSNISTA